MYTRAKDVGIGSALLSTVMAVALIVLFQEGQPNFAAFATCGCIGGIAALISVGALIIMIRHRRGEPELVPVKFPDLQEKVEPPKPEDPPTSPTGEENGSESDAERAPSLTSSNQGREYSPEIREAPEPPQASRLPETVEIWRANELHPRIEEFKLVKYLFALYFAQFGGPAPDRAKLERDMQALENAFYSNVTDGGTTNLQDDLTQNDEGYYDRLMFVIETLLSDSVGTFRDLRPQDGDSAKVSKDKNGKISKLTSGWVPDVAISVAIGAAITKNFTNHDGTEEEGFGPAFNAISSTFIGSQVNDIMDRLAKESVTLFRAGAGKNPAFATALETDVLAPLRTTIDPDTQNKVERRLALLKAIDLLARELGKKGIDLSADAIAIAGVRDILRYNNIDTTTSK